MIRVAALAIVLLVVSACASSPVADEAPSTPPDSTPTAEAAPSDPVPPSEPTPIPRSQLVEILAAGPQKLLQKVVVEPALDVKKKFIGFKIKSLFPGDERFVGALVKPGDVILTINGLPVERPEQFMYVFKKLEKASELVIVLLRKGETVTITYPIVDDA